MNDNDICAICLDNIPPEEEHPNWFNCQHKFHSNCVNQWIQTKLDEDIIPSCPTCKNDCDTSYLINIIIQQRINQQDYLNTNLPIVVIKPSLNINIHQNNLSISKIFKLYCLFYIFSYSLKSLLNLYF